MPGVSVGRAEFVGGTVAVGVAPRELDALGRRVRFGLGDGGGVGSEVVAVDEAAPVSRVATVGAWSVGAGRAEAIIATPVGGSVLTETV